MDALIRYLQGLLGACVQIERGGPEACQGWLNSVQSDYLTLRSADAEKLYLPLHHIRSVTLLREIPPLPADPEQPAPPPAFADILQANIGAIVRLYHAGPEMSLGRLCACTDDYLVLETLDGETVCFALFHIRSLYLPAEGADAAGFDTAEPMQEG